MKYGQELKGILKPGSDVANNTWKEVDWGMTKVPPFLESWELGCHVAPGCPNGMEASAVAMIGSIHDQLTAHPKPLGSGMFS